MVTDEPRRFRRAAIAAFACASLNAAAATCMILFLRPGLPPSADRLEFIRGHALAWRCSWGLWMITGVSLVAFYAFCRGAVEGPRAALWVAVAGLVPDLGAEGIYMVVYPNLIDVVRLPNLDRWTALLSGGIGNGAYTIAWNLLALRTPYRWFAAPGIFAGYGMAISGFANFVPGLMIATAIAIPCFALWALLVGHFYWKKWREADTMSPHV